MKLTSTAFRNEAEIPQHFTCEGADVSPPLEWDDVPEGTRSFALIVDDPDAPDPAAPRRTWVHWVVHDLPSDARGLLEGAPLPHGAKAGKNDWKRTSYGGPCPPIGRHRYFFKLFALDCMLSQLEHPTKAELERAMKGHVLAEAILLGTYAKRK